MKSNIITVILLLLLPFSGIAQDNKTINQNKYFGLLSKEGFRPEIDSDGDIRYKYEGYYYYIDTATPVDMFSMWRTENVASVTSGICGTKFMEAISQTMLYYKTSIVRTTSDCSKLVFKWCIDLEEDQELTIEQFYSALSRIDDSVGNFIVEARRSGLID